MKEKNANIEIIRKINTASVLNELRKAEEFLSRPKVADRLGLSKVTISNIMRELDERGFTTAVGLGYAGTCGGRKPVLVGLDQNRKRVMAACTDAANLELLLSDITGQELKRLRSLKAENNLAELLVEMATEALSSTQTEIENVLGLVLTGNFANSTIESTPTFASHLSKRLNLQVELVPLCHCCAFGENWFYGCDNSFFYFDLGLELETLAVKCGQPQAALGQIAACCQSPPAHGYSWPEISNLGEILSGQNLLCHASLALGKPVDYMMLLELAEAKDARLWPLCQQYANNLAWAISLVTNMLDLPQIIFGGPFSKLWPTISELCLQNLELYTSPETQVEIRLLPKDLANGLSGALAWGLDTWVYQTNLLPLQNKEARAGIKNSSKHTSPFISTLEKEIDLLF